METPTVHLEALVEKVESYASTSIELAKLRMLESAIKMTTKVVVRLGMIAVMAFFFLFLSLGIALLLGELLGQAYLGFFIVAGFYALVLVALHFFLHRWIEKPLSNFIIGYLIQ